MNRRFALCVAIVASLALTGCSRFFIVKDSYNAVTRLALVQYAVNPHIMMGTVNSDEAHFGVANANVKSFVDKMNGKPFSVMPIEEMKANPGYTGSAALDGYFTAPGMKFFTDDKGASKAELSADTAKQLCAALNVDAVAIIYDSWGQQSAAMGFQAKASPVTFASIYDKTGSRIFSDVVHSTSDESMASPGGIIATDVATVVKSFNEAFNMSLDEMVKHINGAK